MQVEYLFFWVKIVLSKEGRIEILLKGNLIYSFQCFIIWNLYSDDHNIKNVQHIKKVISFVHDMDKLFLMGFKHFKSKR